MILGWMIIILMAGGMLAWLAGKTNRSWPKWIALSAMLADFLIMCALWFRFGGTAPMDGSTWLIDHQVAWIPAFGIGYHVALDGLSLVLLLLTLFLGVLSVLCSWTEIQEREGFFYFNLMWTLAGITGVFVAMDLFLFYFFWEVMLIPMYFLIALWGGDNRSYASFKFFIFTQAGGLLMLISILALYFINAGQTGSYSFDYFILLDADVGFPAAKWIMAGFMIAFVIKLPVVPLHNWLPDAHGEAPTAGSLILAGLLLKTGAYGIMRFAVPLFPEASAAFTWWAMLIGVVGIIYGAVLAFSQTDLKRLVAYTSVSHMGFVILGIFAFREIAMQGVVMQMLTHGLSTGALFILAGMLKERLHTRDIGKMGGFWTDMPNMGGIALVFAMASLGLPALGNFIAEFLILVGAFPVNETMTILAALGLVMSALYSLRIVQKVFLGPKTTEHPVKDLDARELIIMGSLTVMIVLLGLFPQPVMDTVQTVVKNISEAVL